MNFEKNCIVKHNQLAHLERTVNFISARCGGGKTQATLKELVNFTGFTIWASPTKELSAQSLRDYKSFGGNNAYRLDSDVTKNLTDEIEKLFNSAMDEEEQGSELNKVVFITHCTLLNPLYAPLLGLANVIVDEIPTKAVEPLINVHHSNTVDEIIKYCEVSMDKIGTSNYTFIKLKDDEQIKEEVNNIVKAHTTRDLELVSNAYSKETIKILNVLLNNYDIAYCSSTTRAGKLVHRFTSVLRAGADMLIANTYRLTILGANIKGSLFGKVIDLHPRVKLVETNTVGSTVLETKHKQPIRIIPYLTQGIWTGELKDKKVKDALKGRVEEITITEDIQKFGLNVFGSDFLLARNKKDCIAFDPEFQSMNNIELVTSQVHGMNKFTHFDKAMVMFACNPSKPEIELLKVFAETYDNQISSTELTDSVTTERYLESAYQALARIGFRLPVDQTLGRGFTVIVPDMRCAKYVAERFENPIIDTSLGYEVKKSDYHAKQAQTKVVNDSNKAQDKAQGKVDKAQKKYDDAYILCKIILLDKKLTCLSMPEIWAKNGTNKAKFERAKKICRDRLINEGLLEA